MSQKSEVCSVYPILFLDIDGVLNCEKTWRTCDEMIDADCLRRLLSLIERNNAKIVLSSSWRGIPRLEERLVRAGMSAHLIGRTPRLYTEDRIRGDEIAQWLEVAASGEPFHDRPINYVIVDDDSDMRPEQKSRFVQTSFESGGLLDHHCVAIEGLWKGVNTPEKLANKKARKRKPPSQLRTPARCSEESTQRAATPISLVFPAKNRSQCGCLPPHSTTK